MLNSKNHKGWSHVHKDNEFIKCVFIDTDGVMIN